MAHKGVKDTIATNRIVFVKDTWFNRKCVISALVILLFLLTVTLSQVNIGQGKVMLIGQPTTTPTLKVIQTKEGNHDSVIATIASYSSYRQVSDTVHQTTLAVFRNDSKNVLSKRSMLGKDKNITVTIPGQKRKTYVAINEKERISLKTINGNVSNVKALIKSHFSLQPANGIQYNLTILTTHNTSSTSQPEKDSNSNNGVIYMGTTGRLGNMIFQFIAAYSIARYNNYHVVYHPDFKPLTSIFPLLNITYGNYSKTAYHGMCEKGWGKYTPEYFNLDTSYNYSLCYYFQSWKYFVKYEKEVHRILQLNHTFNVKALQYIRDVSKNISGLNNVTYVGVHVRRQDMLWEDKIKYGYHTPPLSYILKAMQYFRGLYANVYFLVVSDDMPWCQANLKNQSDVLMSSEQHSGEIDFAILCQCNHTIMTIGTFGWWAGWLSGGTVIYYANFTIPGSDFSKGVNASDLFPHDWIPLYE